MLPTSLRVKPTRAAELVKKLLAVGLLEREGAVVAPHNWGQPAVPVGLFDAAGAAFPAAAAPDGRPRCAACVRTER